MGNGWEMADDELTIDWMDLAPAPQSVLELAFCTCKKSKCKSPNTDDTCCASLWLRCTDMCQCNKCENMGPPAEDTEQDEDEDYDYI